MIRRRSRTGEVERDIVRVSPQIEIAADKFRNLGDPDCLWIDDCHAGVIERSHDICSPITELWIDDWRQPAEGIHDRKHADFLAGRQLIMNKIHRPCLVRLCRWHVVITQLRLDRRFGLRQENDSLDHFLSCLSFT